MRETLLLLGARRLQVPAIHVARKMGIRVVAIDPSPDAPGLALADCGYVYDLADKKQCLDIAERERVNGVMTLAADFPTPMAAFIAQQLKLPGISPRTALLSTNKRHMRAALSDANVPCPISISARSLDEAIHAMKSIGGPVIFKPAVSQGGRGITRLEPEESLNSIKSAYEHASNATRGDGILVEEFVDGPEYSVEALTWDGLTTVVAVTEKLTSGYPHYVEIGHSQPPTCSTYDVEQLSRTASSGVAALGIDWSASHSEIRLTCMGPRVMEIGARLGGGYINTHLVPLSTNVDIVGAAIEIALGRKPKIEISLKNKAAAIRFLVAKPGIIQSISGIEDVKNLTSFNDIDIFVNPGDRVLPLSDADGRLGYVICTGENSKSAIEAAETAKSLISIKTV
ncbi:MAG: ATP-grasp domain-containing protein [Chromatiaceae bacterium]|nr:ATP-grasp domain-containing protein [Chromatiaceae bacterium]